MHPAHWASGTTYAVDDEVTHEGVIYKCVTGHLAATTNEPDAVADIAWQPFWQATTPTWGDFLYGRVPAWFRTLDAMHANSLYRFLRLFGRGLNVTQGEAWDFVFLKDPDQCPVPYLDNFGNSLGMLLPHAVDEASQRRLLATIVQFYRRKGVRQALEFIATRYLGLTLTVTVENWALHYYKVVYDDSGIPIGDRPTIKEELRRILQLYEPAGLIPILQAASDPDEMGDVAAGAQGEGDLNLSFTLNVIV